MSVPRRVFRVHRGRVLVCLLAGACLWLFATVAAQRAIASSRSLNAQERSALVAFMTALTDERVRFERAPFDHPALCVPVGHVESAPGVLQLDTSVDANSRAATDLWALVPVVGRGGNTAPLQTFGELLAGVGRDGSRAHALERACAL